MEIKSLAFMLFCFVVAVAYFALQRTDKQKYVLLAADFYFVLRYSGLKAVIALFLICVAVFQTARQMEKAEKKKGLVLICVDGFPLGWAQKRGGQLKNKYNFT